MKKLLLAALVLFSASALADNLRDTCENAYYADAGGVTTLHQYRVTANFGQLSDHLLKEVEELLYGDGPLKFVDEISYFSSYNQAQQYSITLKEAKGFHYRDYVFAIEQLNSYPGITVNCK